MSRIITVVAVVRVELEPAARFTAGLRDVPGHSDALVWHIWGRVGDLPSGEPVGQTVASGVAWGAVGVGGWIARCSAYVICPRLRGRVETHGVGVSAGGVEHVPRVL